MSLLLFLLLALPQQSPAPPEQVAGTVLRAGNSTPIPRAVVTLTDTETEETAATTTADSEGHYRFAPVPPGKYRLTGAAPGYLTAPYLAHDQYSTAIVTGAGLPTANLTLTLEPQAILSGRVTEDSGDPVDHAQLTLYREDLTTPTHVRQFTNGITDDRGAFEFLHLPPGRYFLTAEGEPWYAVADQTDSRPSKVELVEPGPEPTFKPSLDPRVRVAYPPVFYPDSPTSEGANPIELHPGDRLTADLQLHPQPIVRLTFRFPAGTDPDPGNFTFTRTIFGEPVELNFAQPVKEGDTFVVSDLPAGRYGVSISGPAPVDLGTLDLSSATSTIAVPRAAPTGSATVTVHAARGTTLPPIILLKLTGKSSDVFHADNTAPESPEAPPKPVCTFQDLPRGDYTLTATLNGKAASIVALTVNGKPVLDQHLQITGSAPLKADLTLSPTSVTVEGLALRAGKPAPAAMVVLVPATPSPTEDSFRRDQADLDGTFALRDVPAGRYILIALDDAWSIPWTDPATLAPYLLHGIPVIIPDNAAQTIHLPAPVPTQPR